MTMRNEQLIVSNHQEQLLVFSCKQPTGQLQLLVTTNQQATAYIISTEKETCFLPIGLGDD